MPVWLLNDAPKTSSRSASFITHDATGVPLRPSTPQASGCSSGIWPLALNVVMTGAPSRSASAITPSMSKRAPWPTMITGRDEAAIRLWASASASAGGWILASPIRPSGVPAWAPSAAGIVCTSSGKTRCDTPGVSVACLTASPISSACGLLGNTVWLKAATEPNAPRRSTSWKLCTPSTLVATWPVSASTGARSTFASQRPVNRFVAPGPAIVKHAAGMPVSFAYAEAANAAAPS